MRYKGRKCNRFGYLSGSSRLNDGNWNFSIEKQKAGGILLRRKATRRRRNIRCGSMEQKAWIDVAVLWNDHHGFLWNRSNRGRHNLVCDSYVWRYYVSFAHHDLVSPQINKALQKLMVFTLNFGKCYSDWIVKYYLCQGHFVLFDPTYRNIIGGYSPVVMYL